MNALHATTARRPRKCDLFGIGVSPTTYAEVVRFALDRAHAGRGATIDLCAVHSLVSAATDEAHRARLNAFDVVAPDGQPVRWALNLLHRAGLSDRVYGPELMRKLCRAAADEGVGVYLYGSSPEVIEKLALRLAAWFPGLRIAGAESPPFRPLTPEEDAAAVGRFNASGAGILFLGTGCPKQEIFAHEHRHSIRAVQVCVGAAFDFHAGVKAMAPEWMQRRGLEWLYRLTQEPRRLWRRYLVTNTVFVLLLVRELIRGRRAQPAPELGDAMVPGEV